MKNLRRVKARNAELENMLEDMKGQLEEYADQLKRFETERKQLTQKIADLSDQ